MRIFLAGATGGIGRRLVPELVQAGHEVVGTTRRTRKVDDLRAAGAEPVVVDGLDQDGVLRAVQAVRLVYTTSSTTSRLRSPSGCRTWLRRSGRSRRVEFRPGWCGRCSASLA